MQKISFLGDLMCEEPFLKASFDVKSYNFDKAFEKLKGLCAESDYIVANLETPFAGDVLH